MKDEVTQSFTEANGIRGDASNWIAAFLRPCIVLVIK